VPLEPVPEQGLVPARELVPVQELVRVRGPEPARVRGPEPVRVQELVPHSQQPPNHLPTPLPSP